MWHIIPDSFRMHWKDWEVRFLVLFSLLLQMILLPSGIHRKATPIGWIQVLVWIAYLTAESIPIMTLGVISNWLSNLKNETATGMVARKYELMALWAPILLVHLGGPDTITSFSLEDNELWLRHLARVTVQIGWTCYIYFLALSSSPLSYLAIAIILIGTIKSFERTLSLFRASKDEFRDSLVSRPRTGLLYPRLTESLRLKKVQGHTVTLDTVVEIHAPDAFSLPENHKQESPQDRNVFIASQLLETFRVLFADIIVNLKALGNIKSLFAQVTSESAFKIIDIELNLMFESLYTKAPIIYSPLGAIRKTVTLVLTLGVLLSFCMVDKRVYELKLDVSITFMVILGVLVSEVHSIIKIISSDRMYAMCMERKWNFMHQFVSCIQSHHQLGWLGFTTDECRWSGTLCQFSILGFAVSRAQKIILFSPVMKKAIEKIVRYFSIDYQPFDASLRTWIHKYLTQKSLVWSGEESHANDSTRRPWLPAYGATKILIEELNLHDLIWSTDEIPFSQSIVIWHIATEIRYYEDWKSLIKADGDTQIKCQISRTLSSYLIYLLVQKPTMLPIGIQDNYCTHTLLEARKFFDGRISRIPPHVSKNFGERIGFRKNYGHEKDETFSCKDETKHDSKPNREASNVIDEEHKSQWELDLCRICHMLLEVPYESEIEPRSVEDGENQSVLFHASHLARELKSKNPSLERRWNAIRIVWTEALLYSAYHSGGDVHAKQLSYGGELLTHVWLLMAHFGISKRVKATTKRALKKLVDS